MAQLPSLPGFQALPFRVQTAIVAVALVLVAAGGYMGLAAPRAREVKSLKAQLARADAGPPTAAAAYPPIGDEERNLWRQLEGRLRERFPSEKDLPGALKAVAELARSSRMELVSLSLVPPLPPKPGTGSSGPSGGAVAAAAPAVKVPAPLVVTPTAIKFTALHRYGDLVQFLDGLERLPISVFVESLEVTRLENRLRTDITIRTLRWGAS